MNPLIERILTGVDFGECWISRKNPSNKYPSIKVNKRMIRMHRAMWMQCHGTIPDGLHVCHKCDHPRCLRPSHLFLGTTQENTADKVRKNRQARGERIKMNILTAETVREIRRLYATKQFRVREIAARFGTCKSNVHYVVNGTRWKHVT